MSPCTKGEVKLYISLFLTYVAVIFTWFAAFDCRFFTVHYSLASTSSTFDEGVGLWTHQESLSSKACVLYHDDITSSFDSSFRFARAISMVALVLSIPVAIMTSITLFLQTIKRSYIYTQGVIMFFQTILVTLEFVAFDSRLCKNELNSTSCQLSIAGIYAIVAAVLWFLSGVVTFCMDESEDFNNATLSRRKVHPVITLSDASAESVPVTVQERRTLSDGSIKVITTTTHPDGTRTVSESMEVQVPHDGSMVEVPLEDLR